MAVTTPTNRKELEAALRRAFEVDRLLPPVVKKGASCYLGKMVIIPDDERNCNDVLEDLERRGTFTAEDYELWVASNKWLASITGIEFEIIKLRCSNMGWKRIARVLMQKELAFRFLPRVTLWRYFCSGLDRILSRMEEK